MHLRCTVVIVALLLFAGEGLCTTLCAPEQAAETAHAAPMPSCHDTGGRAPAPGGPPEEHECSGPCEASLTAAGPELPASASQPVPGAELAALAGASGQRPARTAAAPERLPPGPARFLLHASFLI